MSEDQEVTTVATPDDAEEVLASDVTTTDSAPIEIPAVTAADFPQLAEAAAVAPEDEPAPVAPIAEMAAEAEDEAVAAEIAAAEVTLPVDEPAPPAPVAEADVATEAEATEATPEPAIVPEPEAAAIAQPAHRRHSVSTWPFGIYFGVWVMLAGVSGYYLSLVPKSIAVYDTRLYAFTVLGGLVLTLVGPALIFAVWLFTWSRAGEGPKTGMFTSALLKGASATLAGVMVWWIMLAVVDIVRLGRPL